jgi:Domain of unknown function (DUF4158)
VAYRPLLSTDQWTSLLVAPTDERALIRYASLSGEDLDLILSKRGHRNQLGFAVQICLMRFPGRALALNEIPSALLHFLADQLGVNPAAFADYARRDETRREHLIEVQSYLSLRAAAREDRRFALLAAIDAATGTDKGLPIGEAIMNSLRDRGALLLSAERMDRIGRAGRAIARKRTLQAILNGRTAAQLAALDGLLAFDSAIRQTRFGWLGAWSDSPSAANLNGLLDRLDFVRGLAIDPTCRKTVHPERWKQIVREGDAAPAWLAEDFGADRRRATLLAYLINLQERLTDEALRMFCKQIGRLFARAAAACEERHKSSRKETTAALRLFRDTLRVLMEANASNGDAIEMLHDKVGWRRLIEAQPLVEAMVAEKAVNPLPGAAQHHAGLRRYAPRFLAAFQFRASRRADPMIAAIELLTQMHRENRRALPNKLPIGHLDEPAKKLILERGKPDRPLYEVATLGALRDRLRSGDIWVEGSRAYRPLDEYLMPMSAFTEKKDADRLSLGVPADVEAWVDSMRRTLDFQLNQLAYRARAGKLEGVRLVNGALVCRRWKVRFQKPPRRLSGNSIGSCPTFTSRICLPRSMVGPGSPTSSRICARATWCVIAPPFLPPCWPTRLIWAPSAWRKPHPMSANDRLAGRVCSMSGRRLTKRRKQRLSTRIQPTHTPLSGAPAGRRLPMGSSSAPAIAPQVEAT